jgi:4-amino-4-deoxy-L-arabinose transferase-like glycosyltransferase
MAALTTAALLLALYITPQGMGLVNDSVGYIGGARNILAGNGYSRLTGDGTAIPLSNYPPLFSIILAGISLLGVDPLDASRLINVTLFGVNVLLIGVAVRRISGSGFFGWLGAIIFGFSAPILQTHSFAMSEPLFLCLSFLMLLALERYLEEFKWPWLAVSGFAAGLAFITRYMGLSLFGTGLIVLVAFLPLWKKCLAAGFIFLAAGVPLPLVWLVRNMVVAENAANRQIVFHPFPDDKIREGLLNFWGWLLPERSGLIERLLPVLGLVLAALLIIILFGSVAATVMYHHRKIRVRGEKFSLFLGCAFAFQALVYLFGLWLALTFVDASTILEHRILSPL